MRITSKKAMESMLQPPIDPTDKPPYYLSGGIDESPAWELIETRHRIVSRRSSFARSLGYALEGIGFAFRNERNVRIHCILGSIAITVACVLRLPLHQVVLVAVLSLLVLCAELMNTAIESMLDLHAGETFDPTVKHIKDIAAGSVLIVSIGATVLGTSIFLPALIHSAAR